MRTAGHREEDAIKRDGGVIPEQCKRRLIAICLNACRDRRGINGPPILTDGMQSGMLSSRSESAKS